MLELAHTILEFLAPFEGAAFALATLITVAVGAIADKRPLTMRRLREGVLTSVIFMMLGVRGIIFAGVTYLFPDLTIGTSAAPQTVTMAAVGFAVAGVFGVACHKANAAWRTIGALALAATAVGETVLKPDGHGPAFAGHLDVIPVYVGAALALVLALASWSNRTATPHPLRADEKPFDY